jgi:hypothetical protein
MQGGRKAEVRRKVQEKLEKWLAVVSSTALATPF